MFTYNIQYGGDPYEKYERMGETDFHHFMSVFERFPWMDEISKSNANPQGSSPTLSVSNETDGADLWASMSGDRNLYGYLVGYIHTTIKKRWFGLGTPKKTRWLEIYLTRDAYQVKHFFQLYFERKYDQLLTEIRKLERFTALEAKN